VSTDLENLEKSGIFAFLEKSGYLEKNAKSQGHFCKSSIFSPKSLFFVLRQIRFSNKMKKVNYFVQSVGLVLS